MNNDMFKRLKQKIINMVNYPRAENASPLVKTFIEKIDDLIVKTSQEYTRLKNEIMNHESLSIKEKRALLEDLFIQFDDLINFTFSKKEIEIWR